MSAETALVRQLPPDAQRTLYKILDRVREPSAADAKFRSLNMANPALQAKLLRHGGALELLALSGFALAPDGRRLALDADAGPSVRRALDALRDGAR